MLMSFTRMLRLGPLVSLKGSPTVSPTTAALWASLPLPPCTPLSMCFLALSQAPPALAMNTATQKPVVRPPTRRPSTPLTPRRSPVTTGTARASTEGSTISFWAALVLIATGAA